MSVLSGAVENAGPVSRLHAVESFDPADFPVPGGREEEWRFMPLRSSADCGLYGLRVVTSITAERGSRIRVSYTGSAAGQELNGEVIDRATPAPKDGPVADG